MQSSGRVGGLIGEARPQGQTRLSRGRPVSAANTGIGRRTGYERSRDLPLLIPLWPRELKTQSLEAQQRLLVKLRRALRVERRLGLAGHWTYDLARHARLLEAYGLEVQEWRERLRSLGACPTTARGKAPIRQAGLADPLRIGAGTPTLSHRALCQAPSSWPVPSAPQHSSAPPWDNRAAAPTSRGIPQARDCNACAGGASAT